MIYLAYFVFIIFILIYLIDQYMYQNTQYAIVAFHYFTDSDYVTAASYVFTDESLTVFRVLYHVQSFKTFYIAVMISISVKYLAQ